MSETTIEKIHTACFGCQFAKLEGKEQIACNLNLLEDYGDSVVSCFDAEQNKFFVINGRFCHYKRSNKWGVGLDLKQARKKIRQEIAIKIELVVYISVFDEQLLQKTIESAIDQRHEISGISLINHTGNLELSETLGNIASRYQKPWIIRNIVEDNACELRCLDIAIKDIKLPYFISCKIGYEIPQILSKIDRKIHDELKQLMCIGLGTQDPPEAIFGQTLLYKIVQGNAGDYTFWQKVTEIEKEENTNLVIRENDL